MATAGLAAFWLWSSRAVRTVWGMPIALVFLTIFATTVLCKSALSLLLMIAALGALIILRYGGTRLAVAAMIVVPFAYIALRTAGGWSGRELLDLASVAGHERAGSLQMRIDSEDLLWSKASQRPVFGWGGWGRSRLFDEETGRDLAISDGMWVIFAGKYGLVGLCSFWLAMIVGSVRLLWRPSALWRHPAAAGAVIMAVLLAMHMCDNLLNAMMNPLYVLGAGGLAGLSLRVPPARRPAARAVRPRSFVQPITAPPSRPIADPATA
jgi:hypothetical protein